MIELWVIILFHFWLPCDFQVFNFGDILIFFNQKEKI